MNKIRTKTDIGDRILCGTAGLVLAPLATFSWKIAAGWLRLFS